MGKMNKVYVGQFQILAVQMDIQWQDVPDWSQFFA